MTEKEIFIDNLKTKTKTFAVDVIAFCESLKTGKASSVITYQLVKSATSTGANYRAACISRSQKEFFSKICIVVEEIDESLYWLEIIQESKLTNQENKLTELINQATEIAKIMAKAKSSIYK